MKAREFSVGIVGGSTDARNFVVRLDEPKLLRSYHDNVILGVFSLTLLAVLLMVCLDIALVVDALIQRHRKTVSESR